MTGIAIFAHGSSVASANASVHAVAERFAAEGGYRLVETAFLELGKPDLQEAVGRLVSRGATDILVIPYFLTLGIHLQRDLPSIVQGLESIYLGVSIAVTAPLDGHPALLQVLLDRAKDAWDGGGGSERQIA
ncbi:MAG TPA: CbiX/SirB N-terminal domain-containing protein [Bryobacteraceae bacterium]|nr:CbiX/SirB N-terminal domain-containing protein [Bryobacteraceae bacterium]